MDHLTLHSDSQLISPSKMMRHLFMQKIEDPKNTMHYTGKWNLSLVVLKSIMKKNIFIYILFWNIIKNITILNNTNAFNIHFICKGLEIKVLHALHDLVKEKSLRMHMWKGEKKTNKKCISKQYIKVSCIFNSTPAGLTKHIWIVREDWYVISNTSHLYF